MPAPSEKAPWTVPSKPLPKRSTRGKDMDEKWGVVDPITVIEPSHSAYPVPYSHGWSAEPTGSW